MVGDLCGDPATSEPDVALCFYMLPSASTFKPPSSVVLCFLSPPPFFLQSHIRQETGELVLQIFLS